MSTTQPESNEEKEKRKKVVRGQIVGEIISTEETFYKLLKLFQEEFIDKIKNEIKKDKVLAHDPHVQAFLKATESLQKIIDSSEKRLEKLKKPNADIGKIFSEDTEMGKQFSEYVSAYDEIHMMTGWIIQIGKIKELEVALQKKTSGLDVSSLAITPIQRVPRYVLLLQELIKRSEENEKENVGKGLEAVKQAATFINDQKKKAEENAKDEAINKWVQNKKPKMNTQMQKPADLIVPAAPIAVPIPTVTSEEKTRSAPSLPKSEPPLQPQVALSQQAPSKKQLSPMDEWAQNRQPKQVRIMPEPPPLVLPPPLTSESLKLQGNNLENATKQEMEVRKNLGPDQQHVQAPIIFDQTEKKKHRHHHRRHHHHHQREETPGVGVDVPKDEQNPSPTRRRRSR